MFCKLTNQGCIKIQGKEAKKFLQGQLTCDLDKVTDQKTVMGAHCNPQGRIISLFYLFLFKDCYYLLMQKSMITITLTALKKYALFFKVELSDASIDMLVMGYQNIEIPFLLSEFVSLSLESNRYLLIGQTPTLASISQEFNSKLKEITLNEWDYLNILQQIPVIFPDTSGKFLPHDINLDKMGAISFDKGCYTGQEIIARMHYRGKLKNRMIKTVISSDTEIKPGLEFSDGIVVNACLYQNNYHVLIIKNEMQTKRETYVK